MKCTRGFLTAAACVAACVVVFTQVPTEPPPQFRAGVDLFQFEVTVLDKQRQPVRGLTEADFSVLENGVPQRIVGFSEVAFPERDGPQVESQQDVAPDVVMPRYADRRLFVVVMDDWAFAPGAASVTAVAQAKDIAKTFVGNLGPQDFAAVILTRDTRYFPDFTSDPWKLGGAISQFRPPDPAEREYLQLATRGHIGGIVALDDVIAYLAKLPQHRKAIVYISPGEADSFRALTETRAPDVIRAAQESGISIFTVDPSGLSVSRMGGATSLQTLAENTGGYAVVGTNAPQGGLAQIFRQTESYYLIGYQQAGPADGKFRRIDVKLARPGLTAYARSGRKAPGRSDMVAAPAKPIDEGVLNAVTALSHSAGEGLSAYAVAHAGGLDVVAELDAEKPAASEWSGGADVDATISRGTGAAGETLHGRIAPGERSVRLTSVNAPLAAGPDASAVWRVNIRVKGAGASLEKGVDAVLDGPLLGQPLVFRAASPPRAPLRPVASFEFVRSERMHLDVSVLHPVTETRVRLLRKDGEALNVTLALVPHDVNGQPGLSFDSPLSFLAPGDYVLELTARDATQSDRKLVAFRVD